MPSASAKLAPVEQSILPSSSSSADSFSFLILTDVLSL